MIQQDLESVNHSGSTLNQESINFSQISNCPFSLNYSRKKKISTLLSKIRNQSSLDLLSRRPVDIKFKTDFRPPKQITRSTPEFRQEYIQATYKSELSYIDEFGRNIVQNLGELSTPSNRTKQVYKFISSLKDEVLKAQKKPERTGNGKWEKYQLDGLVHWFCTHANEPYPSLEEKRRLAFALDLVPRQIEVWFANNRIRKTIDVKVKSEIKTEASNLPSLSLTAKTENESENELEMNDMMLIKKEYPLANGESPSPLTTKESETETESEMDEL